MTAFDVLSESRQMGLAVWAKDNGKLGFKPQRLCRSELREKLRAHKPQLLPLLRTKGVTWIEVFSERLSETIFFCKDEETRDALIEAGASEWSIYTRDELWMLTTQNRIAPLTDTELRKLHEIRKTLHARITK